MAMPPLSAIAPPMAGPATKASEPTAPIAPISRPLCAGNLPTTGKEEGRHGKKAARESRNAGCLSGARCVRLASSGSKGAVAPSSMYASKPTYDTAEPEPISSRAPTMLCRPPATAVHKQPMPSTRQP
eukprot:4612432-Prymnesium_polylepis.1